MQTVLLSRQLLTPIERIENAALLFEDGLITAVGRRDAISIPPRARTIDFGDAILAPGMIDIHIHGGAGHDVMEGSDESFAAIERFMFRHGVTSYCPTTVTAPLDKTLDALARLADRVGKTAKDTDSQRARPLGVHLEGPFLSHARRGAHTANDLLSPSADIFQRMWDAAEGYVQLLTISPELDGAWDVIAEASRRGVCVSIGHTNATRGQAMAGINAGARHATHTFNAMRRLQHRDPGVLEVVLSDRSITADIIADGIHVNPMVVDLFVRAKGVDAAVLITDSISAAGMPDGTYHLGAFEVEVREGRCESHGKLAGSVLTLDRAIRNVMSFAKISFPDAIRMATLNPARVLGLEGRKGVLQPGADADIVVFTPAGEVRQTITSGSLPLNRPATA